MKKLKAQKNLSRTHSRSGVPNRLTIVKINNDRFSSIQDTMSNKEILCLITYLIVYMIALVLTTYFLSMKCSIDSAMNGNDNLIRNRNKYDIFSVDLSKDGDGKCTEWKSLGFEVFEIIISIFLAITLAYWLRKWKCEKEADIHYYQIHRFKCNICEIKFVKENTLKHHIQVWY